MSVVTLLAAQSCAESLLRGSEHRHFLTHSELLTPLGRQGMFARRFPVCTEGRAQPGAVPGPCGSSRALGLPVPGTAPGDPPGAGQDIWSIPAFIPRLF